MNYSTSVVPFVLAACTVISMLVSTAVWITLMSFKRGQREADFVTRDELQKEIDRASTIYARRDLTEQRFVILEDRIAEVRRDLKDGIQRIVNHIDRKRDKE